MAIAVILAKGKYDMTISYVLPSRKYDMAHINLNSPRKQSLSVDIFSLSSMLCCGNEKQENTTKINNKQALRLVKSSAGGSTTLQC